MDNIRTLLVEDDKEFANDLISLLDRDINIVDFTGFKNKALEHIKNNKYDLLICDTRLADGPEENKYGIDVAIKFRKANPNSKIIGMSTYKENKKYWKEHCNCFWDKDINLIYEKNFKKTILEIFRLKNHFQQ